MYVIWFYKLPYFIQDKIVMYYQKQFKKYLSYIPYIYILGLKDVIGIIAIDDFNDVVYYLHLKGGEIRKKEGALFLDYNKGYYFIHTDDNNKEKPIFLIDCRVTDDFNPNTLFVREGNKKWKNYFEKS